MSLKVAMIGAGSIGFTRRLMGDLLTVPEFADTTFAFTDINQHNLDMVRQLAERDIQGNDLPARIEATTDRRAAIADADYVICMIRQGGLDAFQTDIDIPLKYGIDQCVGDTICAGGILYGQRGIAAILDFCKDIREVAKPGALFLNYSNPMAMLTWAANQYGGVKTVGLCHGVQGAHHQIASCVENWAKKEGLDRRGRAGHEEGRGRDLRGHQSPDLVRPGEVAGQGHHSAPAGNVPGPPALPRNRKGRIDVLKRFGYYSTESTAT
jgi:alpha-galactosidase